MAYFVLAGGSGFIGRTMKRILLNQGHQVDILSTRKSRDTIFWNPEKEFIESTFTCRDAFLINLAGAGVADQRWSSARKEEIFKSRIQSLKTLYKATAQGQLGVQKLVSASAIGYYGNQPGPHTETSSCDDSFLSRVCQRWEEEAQSFEKLTVPVSILRVGIVLGSDAGAWKALSQSFPFGVAFLPGGGEQVYSWIHVEDISRLLIQMALSADTGIVNGVAPEPATLKEIVLAAMRADAKQRVMIPVPDWAIRLALGEMSIEVLKSCIVQSERISQMPFEFHFPDIASCMQQIMKP